MHDQNLQITSSAFQDNQTIPVKYTCDVAENTNPPLKISGITEGAKSLVLIMDDPDAPAGIWDHWVKFNIPVSGSEFNIEEGIEPVGISGVGTSGNSGYSGPCPPDREHRYFFKVYSLDEMLDLSEGATKNEIEKAMEGHILQQGELVGLYIRPLAKPFPANNS
ncbi:YbhB/YbcL family Raf kinase inhibitor-like protein [Patescibacteria group bacterium]|nr:YbhB/YbcL family Raf kinase inhibitor-like protein [Patescibacteria group bacterium]MCG2695178.1 YbhB/YbcL family Raf kinase inhibitor-like protein [Candidatus Parcubacteria bacterium]